MIVGSASNIRGPVVSAAEREALRQHLLYTEGVWAGLDLPTIAAKWSDVYPLLANLDRDADHRATLELTLPPDDLRRVFTDIKESLCEIDGLDPEQALIVAGACERVLGVVGIRGEAR